MLQSEGGGLLLHLVLSSLGRTRETSKLSSDKDVVNLILFPVIWWNPDSFVDPLVWKDSIAIADHEIQKRTMY